MTTLQLPIKIMEKEMKDSIRDILYDLEVDDPAQAITEESIEKAVNRIDLLITTIKRQERLKSEKKI